MNYPYEWSAGGPLAIDSLLQARSDCRAGGRRVVTTNGCFDLLHAGHIRFLSQARTLGDVLVVGVNSDLSVRTLKGLGRPVLPEDERAAMLAALRPVDRVVVFDDFLPNRLLALIQPDIHCKAGDYRSDGLPETEAVRNNGGEICILPFSEGYSSSRLIQRILGSGQSTDETQSAAQPNADAKTHVLEQLLAGGNVLRQTAYQLSTQVVLAATALTDALSAGRKILLCGNGGSAADAQHIAAELVGRFRFERCALPALALTTDSSVLTALGNDYGFEQVFTRQIAALGQQGDVLVAISTSGMSRNILSAVKVAQERGLYVVGLTGMESTPLSTTADLCLSVPSANTAYIQQSHIAILHCICGLVEEVVTRKTGDAHAPSHVS